jgi:exonuclease SbcD
MQAEITEHDKIERLIMGGVECIPSSAFPEGLKYIALGHIHKAQRVDGKDHIRYPGSPIPMSFSEINYKHQVIVFEIENEQLMNLNTLEIPLAIPLLKVPAKHSPLHETLLELERLPDEIDNNELNPYLEVRVLLTGPEPSLRHKIENALTGKRARLAKIDVKYPVSSIDDGAVEMITHDKLHDLKPIDLFNRIYESKYNSAIPDELIRLFHQASEEINQNEE